MINRKTKKNLKPKTKKKYSKKYKGGSRNVSRGEYNSSSLDKSGIPYVLTHMPQICFGTAQYNLNKTLKKAISELHYRHIDCAEAYANTYNNKIEYKNIIKEQINLIDRKNLWITWKDNKITVDKIIQIIKDLDCGYIDLFLIHHSCGSESDFKELRTAQDLKLIRYFGVSNCEDIEIIKILKIKYNIYANQIQARPPGGIISGRQDMSVDFISECNKIGVKIMLFGTISAIININSDLLTEIIDGSKNKRITDKNRLNYSNIEPNIPFVNKYYLQKFIKNTENVLIVSSINFSSLSLEQNYNDLQKILDNKQLLTNTKMAEIEIQIKNIDLNYQ